MCSTFRYIEAKSDDSTQYEDGAHVVIRFY